MVKKGSDIKTVDDLKGKTVGAQLGTTGADYAKKEVKGTKEVRTYDLVDDAFQALETGQVDAVINDFPISKYAERSHKNLTVVQTIPTGEQYGIAFAKESDELRGAVDDALAEIKRDGTLERLYKKWFQTAPPKAILEEGAS
jgi:ABC-type amino acid transport substrate-binding protein